MNTILLTSEESFESNYGAVLQGYALYSILKKLGCNPRIVKYQGGDPNKTYKKHYIIKTLLSMVKSVLRTITQYRLISNQKN